MANASLTAKVARDHMRLCYGISAFLLSPLLLTACVDAAPYPQQPFQPRQGQGQYIRPAWLAPQPTVRIPDDQCNALTYQTLLGAHEGSIYMAGLPGLKRVVKPAELEDFDYDVQGTVPAPPLVEVRDYLPGQSLYQPSIRNLDDGRLLGEDRPDRLTLQLDSEGYVQQVVCG